MTDIKLTVITVCLNAATTIETTIQSVISQSLKNIEFIIIDGESSDGTLDILEKYNSYANFLYISEPDLGIYDAMNKGVQLSKGEWVIFLGSDDQLIDDNVVERVLSLSDDNDVKIIYGNVKFLNSQIIYDGEFDFEKISVKNICQQAIFYKRDVFSSIGLFNLKYKYCADHEFNLRWMGGKYKSKYVPEIITLYNEVGLSGTVVDEVFLEDFDTILLENNIISKRLITHLNSKIDELTNSKEYKFGSKLYSILRMLKQKLFSINE